jgi:hypothetical protein
MKKRTTKSGSPARVPSAPRPRVYLDSTIPSVYCDDREGNRHETEITRRWWREEAGNYEIWVSPATMAELEDGKNPHKAEILEFADALDLLPPDPAVDSLAQHYIQHQVMPRKHLGDAWHLANVNKRRHLETINWRLGLETPEIVTPLALFKEREDL